MDFTLGEDRQALVDVLSRFIRERYSVKLRSTSAQLAPGNDRATWSQLAEIGVIGALFSPTVNGYGGSPFDVTAVFETLGYGLVGEPVLPTLMAGTVLANGATTYLEELISGDSIFAVAFYEPHARYDFSDVRTTAKQWADGWKIDGSKSVVIHAEAADHLIVSARQESGELGLFRIPVNLLGTSMRGYITNDGLRAAELRLDGVEVPDDAYLGSSKLCEDAIAIGTLALCAEALGIMEYLKDATLEYLRNRVQFGIPIGRNQALQHRLAELLIEMEQARSSVINAAAVMDVDGSIRDRALSAAKYTIGTTATRVAEEAIQMHGGIGMTQELDVSHYAKRALMIDHQLGDADHHLSRYIALTAA